MPRQDPRAHELASSRAQIIAYLETGAGKTLIAVMLVKHYAEAYQRMAAAGLPARRKIVVCVVPTTILVAQQAAVFRRHAQVRAAALLDLRFALAKPPPKRAKAPHHASGGHSAERFPSVHQFAAVKLSPRQ